MKLQKNNIIYLKKNYRKVGQINGLGDYLGQLERKRLFCEQNNDKPHEPCREWIIESETKLYKIRIKKCVHCGIKMNEHLSRKW